MKPSTLNPNITVKKLNNVVYCLISFISFLLLTNSICAQQLAARCIVWGKPTRDTIQISTEKNRISLLSARPWLYENSTTSCCRAPQLLSKQSVQSVVLSGHLALDISTFNSTCGQYNGTVIATASGGTPPYRYTIDGNYPRNTGNYTSVLAGTHTIVVTDALNEMISANVVITNLLSPPIVRVSSIKNISNCWARDASVTLEAMDGVPPYQYSMDGINYQSGNVFSNFDAGQYIFYVKDANGCIGRLDGFGVTLFGGCLPVGVEYSWGVCNSEGFISANVGGKEDWDKYTYSIDGINYIPADANSVNKYATFYGLTPGIHSVYFKDADGKVSTFAISILKWCQVKIDFITIVAACQQNDGTLTVTVSNGTPPYEYTIDGVNFQQSNVFYNLWAGNYNVTVRDANGISNSLVATVYDHCPVVAATTTGESCLLNDGSIVATGQKGTTPYKFSIDGINFQSDNTFTGLTSRDYTVTIKDVYGFTATTKATIKSICMPVTTTTENTTCGLNNGSITINSSEGTGLYQYSIDGSTFQYENTFKNLAAGTYYITVKDGNGKQGKATAVVNNTPTLEIANITVTPTSCKLNDGVVSVSTSGGTAPFYFGIDGTKFSMSNIFTGLTSDATYMLTVKDGGGCTYSKSIVMTSNCPVLTANIKNEICGSKNGKIDVTGWSGMSPYLFSIDGINFQAATSFTNLAAGKYTITIKDASGYINTATATVNNTCPTVALTAKEGICGTTEGSITATGANGIAPYQYSLDGVNFQQSNIFSHLSSGSYTITVKDGDGLTNTASIVVNSYAGPEFSTKTIPATCLNNDGSITVSQINGVGPFQYSIDDLAYRPNGNFTNKASGNYTVSVMDANGCIAQQAIALPLNNNLTLIPSNDARLCEGETTRLEPSTNATNFSWSPSQSLSDAAAKNPVAAPVITTTYTLIATLGSCLKTGNVTIVVDPAPIAKTGNDTSICFGQSVQLKGSGGANCVWTPATFLSNQKVYEPTVMQANSTTTYNLIVTDDNGCSSLNKATTVVSITPTAKVFAGNDTSIVINQLLQLTATDINNSGFSEYKWTPDVGLSNSHIIDPVVNISSKTTYTVTASTPSGCIASDDITVTVYRVCDIYVPNAFTPNGDGNNDKLHPIPIGIKEFKYFVVYDRWGRKIFSTANPTVGWDGTVAGIQQPTNTYVWMTEGIDYAGNSIKRKGTALLIR